MAVRFAPTMTTSLMEDSGIGQAGAWPEPSDYGLLCCSAANRRRAARHARCGLIGISQPWRPGTWPTPELEEGLSFRMGALPCARSEEHTSELQSRLHLVCRLLLEK